MIRSHKVEHLERRLAVENFSIPCEDPVFSHPPRQISHSQCHFSDASINLRLECEVGRDGGARVGKLVDHVKRVDLVSIFRDATSLLTHDLCPLHTNIETKVIAGVAESVGKSRYGCFKMSGTSSIIHSETFPHQDLGDFTFGF